MDAVPGGEPGFEPGVAGVQVHLFAAARAAAGTSVAQAQPGTLGEVLHQVVADHPGLAEVLPRCSYLVNEVAATGDGQQVPAGSRVDVLPPFAGG